MVETRLETLSEHLHTAAGAFQRVWFTGGFNSIIIKNKKKY